MAETIEHDQLGMDRPLTDAMRENRSAGDLIPFGEHGVSPQTFTQVVDWAKMMAKAVGVVGPALINNPGACLAVIELGQKFKFSPYMLARGCYSVNGVLAFDGQTIMAIMNKHMPLAPDENGNKTRLKYTFSGEKTQYGEPEQVDNIDEKTGEVRGKIWQAKLIKPSTRKVLVTGRMLGEADVLEYESPTVFNIKNKKSPLWVEDEDQQLRYWASRRWQRAHWPEGLLGIYDTDDAAAMHIGADNAKLIEATDNPGEALLARIQAAKVQTDDADKIAGVTEGFKNGHAEKETGVIVVADQGKPGGDKTVEVTVEHGDGHVTVIAEKVTDAPANPAEAKTTTKKKAKAKDALAADPELANVVAGAAIVDTAPPADEKLETTDLPTNSQEWRVYAMAWVKAVPETDNAVYLNKRWKEEVSLRNSCGVTEADRDAVYDFLLEKRHTTTAKKG